MKPETKKGLNAISPLILFLGFYLIGSIVAHDFSAVPITVAFFVALIYAVAITKGLSLPDRVRVFGRGAGTTKMMFIILLFLIAGAFAKSAEAMGCIDATVNVILNVLPPRYIYVSIFVAGCVVSMATGSGIGSIVALGPIAVGIGHATGGDMPLLCAIVVCGAMFGDNLSFISDTTIIATSTQGCNFSDKFKTNLWMALPAAVLSIILYFYLGTELPETTSHGDADFIKMLPYLLVVGFSIAGGDVLIVLLSGTLLCGIMGMCMGEFDFYGWLAAIDKGMTGMGELAIIMLFAAGLMALISHNGGLDFLIKVCTRFVRNRRSAEGCIALLTGALCVCTSNNTIAIVSAAPIVKELATKFGVDPRKAASIMDTSSCVVQELIPYSTHLLAAAAFAGISGASLIPYVFYSYLLLFFLIISIIFNIPRFKTAK